MNPKRSSFVQIVWLVLCALCVLYGIVILSIASGIRFFMVWFLLAAFFGCLFLASRAQLWSHLPGRVKAVFLIILFFCAALFAVVEGIIAKGFTEKGEKDLDYLIVLGAQVRENGPSPPYLPNNMLREFFGVVKDFLQGNL